MDCSAVGTTAKVSLVILLSVFLQATVSLAQSPEPFASGDQSQAETIEPGTTDRTVNKLVDEGVAAYRKGNVDGALTKFKQALEADSSSSLAHFNLGTIYYEKNELENAIFHYRRVTKLDPDNPKAHYYLGLSYGFLEETIDARTHLKRALELDRSLKKARKWLRRIDEEKVYRERPLPGAVYNRRAENKFTVGVHVPGVSLGYRATNVTTELRFSQGNDISIYSLRIRQGLWGYSKQGNVYWGLELGQVQFKGNYAEGSGQIVSGFSGFQQFVLPLVSLHLDMGPQLTRLEDDQTQLSTSGLDFIINTGMTLHFF